MRWDRSYLLSFHLLLLLLLVFRAKGRGSFMSGGASASRRNFKGGQRRSSKRSSWAHRRLSASFLMHNKQREREEPFRRNLKHPLIKLHLQTEARLDPNGLQRLLMTTETKSGCRWSRTPAKIIIFYFILQSVASFLQTCRESDAKRRVYFILPFQCNEIR